MTAKLSAVSFCLIPAAAAVRADDMQINCYDAEYKSVMSVHSAHNLLDTSYRSWFGIVFDNVLLVKEVGFYMLSS
jgi:hypothetical protein